MESSAAKGPTPPPPKNHNVNKNNNNNNRDSNSINTNNKQLCNSNGIQSHGNSTIINGSRNINREVLVIAILELVKMDDVNSSNNNDNNNHHNYDNTGKHPDTDHDNNDDVEKACSKKLTNTSRDKRR